MNKKIVSALVAVMMFSQTAFASVLGNEIVDSKSYDVSDGTILYENKFMSDQAEVGLQSEYYAEYTPNSDTVPVVVNGETVFGKRTAEQAAAYMQENGMRPMIGINAAFFSLQTGITMGHIISDGRVVSKDNSTLQGIGFNADGTAFIAPLSIDVTLYTSAGDVGIDNVNKYNVATLPYISLFTSDFADRTENEAEVISVVVETGEDIRIGGSFEAVVKSKSQHTGGIELNDGEMVLTVNVDGSYDYHRNLLNSLSEGDVITIGCTSSADYRWENAREAIASVGETLVSGGMAVDGLPAGAAPRTAIGITGEGKIVFYVIDGRQPGVSYGAQLKTLAERMIELGCVDAINLDGGGSTSISGVYPGADEMAVLNSPSDGSLRNVANFIFLKNNNPRTDILGSIYTTPHQNKYLSGTRVELSSVGIDTAYYKMPLEAVEYSAEGESYVEGNVATLLGDGTVRITAKSGAVQSVSEYYVYKTPERISVTLDGKDVSRIIVPDGAKMLLDIKAFLGSSELISDAGAFNYEVSGDIGTMQNGVFLAKANRTTSGTVTISAGDMSVSIPVTVTNDNIFKDISGHWAKNMIKTLADMNVISGYETEDGLYFMPDNGISRAEFAVLLARYLGIDTKAHEFDETGFADELPKWARGSINALYAMDVISGKQMDDAVVFAPNDEITRAEAAAIIGRAIPELSEEAELTFTDNEEIPTWARSFVAKLYNGKVVSGGDGNNFMPNKSVTRAESATMLYKLTKI